MVLAEKCVVVFDDSSVTFVTVSIFYNKSIGYHHRYHVVSAVGAVVVTAALMAML
jgi:hypothetical protein